LLGHLTLLPFSFFSLPRATAGVGYGEVTVKVMAVAPIGLRPRTWQARLPENALSPFL
jgi:hypothetical protein